MDDTTVKVLLGVIAALLALSSSLAIALLANIRADVKEMKGDLKETRTTGADVNTRLQVVEAQINAKIDQVDKKIDVMLATLTRRIEKTEEIIDLTGDRPTTRASQQRAPEPPAYPAERQ